ncbi:MAG: dihydroorotate dehydrogenase [Candidatus Saganbacteria bacterium]|nr:dihydroorotate dehydrogenase [Candidatus Saganbacteria bacterium]
MSNLSIEIAGIRMKNPVMVASGTFGFSAEYQEILDISKLGAIITKSITLKGREGNPPPRVAETAAGMLNSIGLQNDGIEAFLKDTLPTLSKFNTPLIVNIAGETIDEYVELARILTKEPLVKGIEVNISCPNVKRGGMTFGIDPKSTEEVIKSIRAATTLPLIAKLTPNVTDITSTAKAAVDAGADALSLINTLVGMVIDIETKRSKLGTLTGGLSGPAIKPIAVRMVFEVAKKVKVPIIGIGGIISAADAIEFFLAGASAVQIGTGNFVDPETPIRVIGGINEYLDAHKIPNIKSLIGNALKT